MVPVSSKICTSYFFTAQILNLISLSSLPTAMTANEVDATTDDCSTVFQHMDETILGTVNGYQKYGDETILGALS